VLRAHEIAAGHGEVRQGQHQQQAGEFTEPHRA
jgi:hypothetical protein